MEYKEITKQIFSFQKKAFDNAFNTMRILQNQTEKIGDIVIKNSPWVPEKGKEMITEYRQVLKKNLNGLKKIVDEKSQNTNDR